MATNTRGPISHKGRTSSTAPSTNKKKFVWKAADPEWHPEVKGMYNSLKKSAHFDDFEESDMYFARLVAIEHTKVLQNTVEINAAHTKLVFEQWKELATTLGTRKRLAIEIEKVQEDKNSGQLMSKMVESIITGITK